jgi:hypothetical protein
MVSLTELFASGVGRKLEKVKQNHSQMNESIKKIETFLATYVSSNKDSSLTRIAYLHITHIETENIILKEGNS